MYELICNTGEIVLTEETQICLRRTGSIAISSTTDFRVAYLGYKPDIRSVNTAILYRISLKYGE